VDDSGLGSPARAGYGGIIRNNSGFYLSGFSGFIRESSDIMLAELFVIYQELTLAKDLAVEELICYATQTPYFALFLSKVLSSNTMSMMCLFKT
jgi:hypothetical protein